MSSELGTEQEAAEWTAQFYELEFWKQVAAISGGLLYLGVTRVIIPAVAAALIIEAVRWLA